MRIEIGVAYGREMVYNNGGSKKPPQFFFCFMEQFFPSVHLYSVSGYKSKEVADGNQ